MVRKLLILLVICSINVLHADARALQVRYSNGKYVVFTPHAPFFARILRGVSHKRKAQIIQMIRKVAKKEGVDPALAVAIAKIESDFNPSSVSDKNAIGVMQLTRKTAQYYGVKDINNVRENIRGGVLFLKHLIQRYHDPKLVAAAYNAGETAVQKYHGIPPFSETQRYVQKFLRAYGMKQTVQIGQRKTPSSRRILKRNGVYTNIGSLW